MAGAAMFPHDVLVVVQGEWNGWRKAFVPLSDLQDIHWLQPKGAPKPLIHAHVPCTSVMEGDIPHDCQRTPAPHRLLVCVLKCHSTVPVYAELARRAGHEPALERLKTVAL
jgi:hypothetical protein